jgi:Peptidase_C39 like family
MPTFRALGLAASGPLLATVVGVGASAVATPVPAVAAGAADAAGVGGVASGRSGVGLGASAAAAPGSAAGSGTIAAARAAVGPGAASTSAPRYLAYRSWQATSFDRGRFARTRADSGLVIGAHPASVTYRDPYGSSARHRYDRGRWYSPWTDEHFALTQLIASYTARTPRGTFIEVSARGRTESGRSSSWDSLGRWASYDGGFHRMSLGSQSDDLARVSVDTLVVIGRHAFGAWQLRVTLMRRTGSAKTPTVRSVGAVVSRLPAATAATSTPLPGRGRELAVPRFSQMIHTGEYPRWNGGGEAWCSPTSTSMVLAYWDRGPTPAQYAWVRGAYRQPWVDYAARYTYASGYDGTGDWPFNTAYAGRFHLDAFVTRLRSLRQAAAFVKAGIPLVASISFGPGELDGAPIGSTAGHLVVIRGFTAGGRVIVNDPAASSAQTVRRVYRRDQFERAWVDSTGGVVYVIRPASQALPPSGPGRPW